MFNYRVEISEWFNDSGFSYTTTIDNFDEKTSALDYIEICADGPEGILKPVSGDDMRIEVIDNRTNNPVSVAWLSDVYNKWYGENWLEKVRRSENIRLEW